MTQGDSSIRMNAGRMTQGDSSIRMNEGRMSEGDSSIRLYEGRMSEGDSSIRLSEGQDPNHFNWRYRSEYQALRKESMNVRRDAIFRPRAKSAPDSELLPWKASPSALVIVDPVIKDCETTSCITSVAMSVGVQCVCVSSHNPLEGEELCDHVSSPHSTDFHAEDIAEITAEKIRNLHLDVVGVLPGGESSVSLSCEVSKKLRNKIKSNNDPCYRNTTSPTPTLPPTTSKKKTVKFKDTVGEPLEEMHYVETLYDVPKNPLPCNRSTTKREMNYEDIELKFSEELDDSDEYVTTDDEKYSIKDGVIESLRESFENLVECGMLMTLRNESTVYKDEHGGEPAGWLRRPSWSWTKKWCELRVGALAYYASQDSRIPIGVIPISHSRAYVSDATHFSFRITYTRENLSDRRWKEFRCQSKQEMHDWIRAINTASCVDMVLPKKELVRKSLCRKNLKSSMKMDKGATHLLLVRHGHAKNMLFRMKDCERPLTELGKHQAYLTAEYLRQYFIARQVSPCDVTITHSTLVRTAETAEIIRRHIPGAEIQSCVLLKEGLLKSTSPEHYDKGDLESHRIARLKMAYRSFCVHSNKKMKASIQDIERFEQVFDPANTSVRYGDCYKVIICHANVIHYFVSRTMGLPPDKICGSLVLNHCSITQIDINTTNGVTLHSVNHCGHLPANYQTEN